MNTQEKAALESLISKLNSLRKTLSDEEREILDSMVITDFGADEVSLHQLPPEGVLPPDAALPPDSALPPDAAFPPEEGEVSLHQLPPEGVLPPDAALPPDSALPPDAAFPPEEGEVSLHTMKPKSLPVITFDKEKEVYKIAE